jgi:hypothetical protein
MSTHLYCVLPRALGAPVPAGLTGIDGADVRALEAGPLSAWVSDIDHRLPISIDGVRAHDAVVEGALETGSTPVPARYGQRFDSDDACCVALVIRASSIESLLANIEGQVEMTLILTPSTKRMIRDLEPVVPTMFAEGASGEMEPGAASLGAGRQYLERLRAREEATHAIRKTMDSLADRLAEAATRFVRRSAMHEQMTQLPLRTMSHLISREAVDQYKEVVGAVRAGSESRFLVIGPRAPYSFCALGGAAGAHGMKLAD